MNMVPHGHKHPTSHKGDVSQSADEAADVLQENVGGYVRTTGVSLVVDGAFSANVRVIPEWRDEVAILDARRSPWEFLRIPVGVELTK